MEPHEFWQEIHAPDTFDTGGPFEEGYPAVLEDGRQIRLPIRALADGHHGLASLIINQSSFTVQDALAHELARHLAPLRPDVIVGLPTLGLTLAAQVARKLGHSRYVPLGTSRKFWYDEKLSVSISSITTPDQAKRLYIDPRMLPVVQNKRVVLVDDVVSSGTSMRAGLDLLSCCDIEPIALTVAMVQTSAWKSLLDGWPERMVSVFSTPRLEKTGKGWIPLSE